MSDTPGTPTPIAPPEDLGSGGTGRGPGRSGMIIAFLVVLAGALLVFAIQRGSRPATPARADASPADAIKSVDAALNAAETLRKSGDFAKAERILTAAGAQFPKEQQLFVSCAELLAEQHKNAEALAQYEKALEIGPREERLEMTAGTLASMLGKVGAAEQHYAAAQSLNKRDFKPALFLAQVQIKQNNTEEAKKNLLIAASLNPDSAVTWGTLADLAYRENKLELAKQHIDKARALEPEVTTWRLIEARILRRENEPEKALALLTPLDASQQRDPGVMQVMSECYGLLSRPGDAAGLYAAASDKDPAKGDLAFQAAVWYDKAGERDNALKYAQRAAFLNTEGAQAMYERLKGR